jgi:hypothetical protein
MNFVLRALQRIVTVRLICSVSRSKVACLLPLEAKIHQVFSFCYVIKLYSAGIAHSVYRLDYGLDLPGFVSLRFFFFVPPRPVRLWGSPSLLSKEYRGALSPGVKWLGPGVDHSPPSVTKVKNAWSYTSTPLIRPHDVVLDHANKR